MKEARLYVDFNEMIDDDLVLLSKTDFKKDSQGNLIELKEGLKLIFIQMILILMMKKTI